MKTKHTFKLALASIFVIASWVLTFALSGCGASSAEKKRDEFFTSGSREADQRATQRMAKEEQLAGSGEGAGEKGRKKVATGASASAGGGTNIVEGKQALFERLGGEGGISNIVADFLPRALQDPRVNWQRRGVKTGWFGRGPEVAWSPTPVKTAALHKHMVQFLALATGGPARYEGKEMKSAHEGMKITNSEFDAAIGDLKASLDKLQIPNKEQKELLAIIESTRPQVVTER
ncbi:MAG TPA: group 1 truncated hemoglobin [Verrucomicrobiae bacterium]|nr:group 1 truncated hemoglobin [Verrucomicrobiae bacterium]